MVDHEKKDLIQPALDHTRAFPADNRLTVVCSPSALFITRNRIQGQSSRFNNSNLYCFIKDIFLFLKKFIENSINTKFKIYVRYKG